MSGIRNFGNTCYMNSVVQLLRYTKPVVKPLVLAQPSNADAKLFLDLLYQGADPKDFVKQLRTLGFDPVLQHDAHEFFITMVDKLYESVPHDNPFEGKYVSTLTCANGHRSVTKESFICMSLNGNIREGIDKLSQPETVRCKCDHCAESTMEKVVTFDLGEAVCFHFIRFDHTFRKLNYSVPILKQWNGYDLVGMCNHFGGVHGGHYTSTMKTDDGWVVANDEKVHKIDNVPAKSNMPYLMVYVRSK